MYGLQTHLTQTLLKQVTRILHIQTHTAHTHTHTHTHTDTHARTYTHTHTLIPLSQTPHSNKTKVPKIKALLPGTVGGRAEPKPSNVSHPAGPWRRPNLRFECYMVSLQCPTKAERRNYFWKYSLKIFPFHNDKDFIVIVLFIASVI